MKKKIFKNVDGNGVIEYANRKGQLHREDGPAFIDGDYHVWILEGMFHREDGPAIEYPNGDIEYWLEHVKYTKEEFELEIVNRKLEKVKNL